MRWQEQLPKWHPLHKDPVEPRVFRKFEEWEKVAKLHRLNVRLVTKSKTNNYYQAIRGGCIVGFFNTGLGMGNLTLE